MSEQKKDKIKNIYNILEITNFKEKVDDGVRIFNKDRMAVEQFMFSFIQKFYETIIIDFQRPCSDCGGRGKVRNNTTTPDKKYKLGFIKCETCNGTGFADSKAWCPDCGDEIFIENGVCKPNEHWRYYCMGCDKSYQLEESPKDSQWQMLDGSGRWVNCEKEPEPENLRKMKYGKYSEIYHGIWKDKEEAIYRKLK